MAVDIGPKIGIDGEAEFRKELNNLSQQMKTLGSEMKVVTSAFADNDKSQEALSAQADVLTRQIQTQEQRLAQLQKGLEASSKKYGENDTKTLKWAQAVNNATADLNKMRSQLEKTNQSMDQTEGGMEDLADATEDAGEAAAQADGKFGAMTAAMGNLISSGIQAAISAVGELIGSIVNLDETTEEYRAAQGKLNTAFEAAGYGAEAAQAAYGAFYGILGDTDTATEASQLLAKLSDSTEDISKWTDIAAGVYGTFGDSLPVEGLIEASNETAKVGQVTGVLADALNWAGISEDAFNEALAQCSSESERNQLIMDTLSGTYDEASDAFYQNNAALVASRDAQAQMDAALAGLGETIAAVKTSLTADFLPAISQVITAFSGLLSGAEGADAAFSQAVGGLVQKVAEQLPAFLSMGTSVLSALASGIIQSLPTLAAAALEIIASIVTALGDLLYQVADVGGDLLGQLAAGIQQGLPNLMESLPGIITGILGFIAANLPAILAQGVSIVNSITDGVLEAIPEFVAALPEIITSFVTFVAENLPAILFAGVDLLIHLAKGIVTAIPKLVAELPNVITAVTSGLAKLFPQIIQTGVNILARLWDGIFSAIPQLVDHLPEIISSIVEGFQNLMGGIADVGLNIVKGLWEGIKSGAGWLMDKISGWAGDILDGIKDFFGIHSPSALFRDEVGRYLAQGVGVGFEREMQGVATQMQRSIPTLGLGDLQSVTSGLVTGLKGIGGASQDAGSVPPIVLKVYLDKTEIAEQIFDPLNDVSRRRGQPIGAH